MTSVEALARRDAPRRHVGLTPREERVTDTTTALSRWQDPENDGFPTDEYFTQVEKALTALGIGIEEAWRDEPWDYTLQLAEGYTDGYAKLYVSWRVDEMSEPLKGEWPPTVGGICGWYWVPYSNPDKSLGDFAESFRLDVLAEPEEVAAAVAELVGARTINGAPTTWSDAVPPGGLVCAVPDPTHPDGICGMPVESEPCPTHNPTEEN